MKNQFVALSGLVSLFMSAPAFAQRNDFATADGSLRAGLHAGKVYAVLTGNDTDVVLEPDKFASDDENKAWTLWLSDFDNALFTNWSNADGGDGQQTAWVVVRKDGATVEVGQYYPGTAGGDAAKFTAAVKAAVDKTFKAAGAMPVTKNPFKEIRYVMTFMDAPKMVPITGPEKLGFLGVLDDKGESVTVYGRIRATDGQAPGIQILSDMDGGKIDVTENPEFLQRLKQYGVAP